MEDERLKTLNLNEFKARKILKILIPLISVVGLFFLIKELFWDIESVTRFSQSAGIFAPILLIILISLGILFSPIPSFVFIITAGYLYGIWKGAIFSYIGHLLAATFIFAFFRSFKIKNESKRYTKYKKIVEKNKKILYLLYAVPVLPMFLITLVSASSGIKWKKFIEMISVSFIPVVLFFSFFGSRISNKNMVEITILTLVVMVAGVIFLKVIQNNKKRVLNGYPSMLKLPKSKKKHKYLNISHSYDFKQD